MSIIYKRLILLSFLILVVVHSNAQFGCDPTPMLNMHSVNLPAVGNMVSINTSRDGTNCCGGASKCVLFKVYLGSGLCLTMDIPTPGSTMVWKDNCSMPLTNFNNIKPASGDSIRILVCKPGADKVTYKFTAVSCCMLDVTCPSSNGGLYQCRESFPVPVADTIGFRLLGGLVRNFCDSVKITSQDSFNSGKACIGDTMILYRTYKIKDSRDSVLCRILYRAVDYQAPMISCPANVTISCAADTSATARGFATATDNCDPA